MDDKDHQPYPVWVSCPNLDCQDGKVTPALATWEFCQEILATVYAVLSPDDVHGPISDVVKAAMAKYRAEVVAEIVEFLRAVPFGHRLILTSEMADRIERQERGR